VYGRGSAPPSTTGSRSRTRGRSVGRFGTCSRGTSIGSFRATVRSSKPTGNGP
jgi:hypothetical protein